MTCPILYFELFQIFESRMIRVEISCSMRDTLGALFTLYNGDSPNLLGYNRAK